jgi:hypothetical protein
MAQTPGAVPEQPRQAAPKPGPVADHVPDPESLMAILKRATGPDDKAKRPAKLAAVPPPPPPGAAPAPPRIPSRPPQRASERPDRPDRPERPERMDRPEGDPIDSAGHAVIALLQNAAEASNQELDRASIMAGRLAGELRATENRIRELEAEVAHYRDRAARAEDWLQQIGQEIQSKLLPPRRGGQG